MNNLAIGFFGVFSECLPTHGQPLQLFINQVVNRVRFEIIVFFLFPGLYSCEYFNPIINRLYGENVKHFDGG